jgi:hypothetical protein
MSGDYPPRRYDFGSPAVCQRDFTHAGVDYKRGDAFPYDQLGIDRFTLRGFWMSSMIDFPSSPPQSSKNDKRAQRAR